MNTERKTATGRCLCGGVRFNIQDAPDTVSVCHCETCRRWSGGPLMAVDTDDALAFEADGPLVWYRSSDWAERGFCRTCGTSLFYRLVEQPGHVAISAGTLDDPGALARIERHIFVDEKPGFYEFADDTPRLTGAEAMAEFTGEEQ